MTSLFSLHVLQLKKYKLWSCLFWTILTWFMVVHIKHLLLLFMIDILICKMNPVLTLPFFFSKQQTYFGINFLCSLISDPFFFQLYSHLQLRLAISLGMFNDIEVAGTYAFFNIYLFPDTQAKDVINSRCYS